MQDNYLTPNLTNEGISMLIRAMDGEQIKFTKLSLGDGTPNDMTNIKNLSAAKLEIGISDFEKKDDYIILTGYCNSSQIEESFYAKELGVYAEDSEGNEILYAYRYTESEVDFFPAKDSGRALEVVLSVVVQITNAENVFAILIDSDAFASKADFDAHCKEKNPHKITIDDIGASPANHTHDAADIGGILQVGHGGTGVTSYKQLADKVNIFLNVKTPHVGVYTGDGKQGRVINLGFKPNIVILCDNYSGLRGIAVGKYGCCSSAGSVAASESWQRNYTSLMIVDNGFKVNYHQENKVYSNVKGRTYRFIAFE